MTNFIEYEKLKKMGYTDEEIQHVETTMQISSIASVEFVEELLPVCNAMKNPLDYTGMFTLIGSAVSATINFLIDVNEKSKLETKKELLNNIKKIRDVVDDWIFALIDGSKEKIEKAKYDLYIAFLEHNSKNKNDDGEADE